MKKILVLGAGLVSGPLIEYHLQNGHEVTVADIDLEKARNGIRGYPGGKAVLFDIEDDLLLGKLVQGADVVISLLPPAFHPLAAAKCIEAGIDMATTSYISPEMQALDEKAKEAGVTIISECGVDPGLDHMSALKIIHSVRREGGHVERFMSYCGGLPAPEANDNPYGYKFSWSPRGVLQAGLNAGIYKKDGEEVFIEGKDLFSHYWLIDIPGFGELETYPNRNSLGYLDLYTLKYAKTMFRGTLRYKGWCGCLKAMVDIGYLSDAKGILRDDTFAGMTDQLLNNGYPGNLRERAAGKLNIPAESEIIYRLEWLGLFSDNKLSRPEGSPLDNLVDIMLKKMPYQHGERDMIILCHKFNAQQADGSLENITSTLIDYGVPGGYSSMARTVSLPTAIASKLMLERKFSKPGVHIPVYPELYNPILDELQGMGIKFREERKSIEV